ncbi:hypothetical protein [Nostoc sp.]|uniref:hypothetical protein n=1 Tax=Nostoc sp. TaxID=1180 RepID=UPI002FF98A01
MQIVYITNFLYLDSFTPKNQAFVVRWALGIGHWGRWRCLRRQATLPLSPHNRLQQVSGNTLHSQGSTHP